jgi:hypothetical protein
MEQALLDQALASIEYEEEKIKEKWITEIKDRMEAVETGKAKLIDFDSLYPEEQNS